jgi:hypothetical protein
MRELSEHISANFGRDINWNIFCEENQSSLFIQFLKQKSHDLFTEAQKVDIVCVSKAI